MGKIKQSRTERIKNHPRQSLHLPERVGGGITTKESKYIIETGASLTIEMNNPANLLAAQFMLRATEIKTKEYLHLFV